MAALLVGCLLLVVPSTAAAQWDLSVFVGRAYPTADERLVIRLPSPAPIPGLDIQPTGTPEIRGEGGPVFGASLTGELAIIGIEGRLDVVDLSVALRGVRYDLRFTPPVFGVESGAVTIGDARFDADRLRLLSLNLRLRTPGPVAILVSGGVSYLPSFDVTGSVPIQVELGGLPGQAQPNLRLRVTPGQADHRFGVNGGAGLRIGGRVGLVADARVFYFRSYELGLVLDDAQPLVNELLDAIDPVRFRPIIVNATVGVSLRFP